MKIDLTRNELQLIAEALNAYADKALEGDAQERKHAEIAGRKLCRKFLDAINLKVDGAETETAFEKAREDFCGLANDEDL